MIALGLGTNQGDRLGHLRTALLLLKREFQLVSVSPVYESKAMLPEGAPASWDIDFLNIVALFSTDQDPRQVLQTVKQIETRMGRETRERWAPRVIDIDVLAFDDRMLSVDGLQIPHAGIFERPFVTLPLADVWPEWKTPKTKTALEGAARWAWSSDRPFHTKKTPHSLTRIVSIINVTPDSFSGDGVLPNTNRIAGLIQAHIDAGASVIDIGAESTRPGGTTITPEEEWSRIEPVFRDILPSFKGRVKIGLDSRNFETVEKALEFGLDWINDVSGVAGSRMRILAAQKKVPVVAMHSLTVPVQRGICLSDEIDPVEELLDWGRSKIKELEDSGVEFENIILDPGIGFGKTPLQNQYILNNAARLHEWGTPVFIGHSRKSFFNPVTHLPPGERDFETAVLSARLAGSGIEYLRVHDPALTARALAVQNFFPGSSR